MVTSIAMKDTNKFEIILPDGNLITIHQLKKGDGVYRRPLRESEERILFYYQVNHGEMLPSRLSSLGDIKGRLKRSPTLQAAVGRIDIQQGWSQTRSQDRWLRRNGYDIRAL